MARSENWALKHVADVIHEEENQQSWSEMQSVLVFERGTQESVQRAPVHSNPVRTNRWLAKKATYSHNMWYVWPSAAQPPPAVRAAAAQAAAALSTAKVPVFHTGDVGWRLTAVRSARPLRMCVEGARRWVT